MSKFASKFAVFAAAAALSASSAFAQAQMPQMPEIPAGAMEAAMAAMGQMTKIQQELTDYGKEAVAAKDKAGREAAWSKLEASEKKLFAILDANAKMLGGMVGDGQLDAARQMYYQQAADTIRDEIAGLADPEAKAFFEGKIKDYEKKANGGEAPSGDGLAFKPWPGKSGVMFAKNIPYGKRLVGAGAVKSDVAQIYDLYLPGPVDKLAPKSKFFLYIHGGAWSEGNKDWPVQVFAELAQRGYMVASMNYVLNNPALGGAHSFAEMLADVDAMVSHVPELAKKLGVEIPKIAVGGSSAGGHLALLYGYDGANPSVLNLGLAHKVPVACLFSDCGPTDLASPEFSVAAMKTTSNTFLDSCALFSTLTTGKREYQGIPELVKRATEYSPVHLVCRKSPPTICLYGRTGKVSTSDTYRTGRPGEAPVPFARLWKEVGSAKKVPPSVGTDGIVATQNYVALTNSLHVNSVPYAAKIAAQPHTQILFREPKSRVWLYKNLDKYMDSGAGL